MARRECVLAVRAFVRSCVCVRRVFATRRYPKNACVRITVLFFRGRSHFCAELRAAGRCSQVSGVCVCVVSLFGGGTFEATRQFNFCIESALYYYIYTADGVTLCGVLFVVFKYVRVVADGRVCVSCR